MEYTTLARLKSFLSITDDSQDAALTILITQATALVDIELGDNLEAVNVTRRVDGNGAKRIIMENRVTAVASVTDIQTGIVHEVDFIDGCVVYLTRETARGQKNIEIAYSKGYAAVPDDFERFFWQYCKELLTVADSGDTETVKSQSLGGGLSLTYFSPSELRGRLVDLDMILEKYRNFMF